MTSPYLEFGAPPDLVAWIALLASLVGLALALFRAKPLARLLLIKPRRVVGILAATAFLLSYGYLAYYLKGGPRIIDATSYWLEARSFAAFGFTFDVPSPTAAFRGRFLITPEGAPLGTGSTPVGVIFPPGYPLLLAAGFLAGAPLLVGPLCGAALVVLTYALAERLFARPALSLTAAALSVVCATLRYHTADTMSHGFCAVLFASSLWFSLGRAPVAGCKPVAALVSGLLAGWLIATRPVTGAVLCFVLFVIVLRGLRRAWFLIGLVPFVLLLLAHQHAVSGSFWESSQLRYYALSDGPPGCFGYGFGDGLGCVFEHGDVVKSMLSQGYGAKAAILTSLQRLQAHAIDLGNLEIFVPVLVIAAVRGFRLPAVRLLTGSVLGVMLAYAPFYFNGSYPGGGARLYADILPLEHILLAFGLLELKIPRFAVPVALSGFALHASFSHRALSDREGGRPMFEPQVVERAGITDGLIFLSTDHGFNLAFDPSSFDSSAGSPAGKLLFARANHDARDTLLWQRLGSPPSFIYRFDPFAPHFQPELVPYTPKPSLRFEAESEWPALDVQQGWLYPAYPPTGCAGGARTLELHSNDTVSMRSSFEIYVPHPGAYKLHARWITPPSPVPTTLKLSLGSTEIQTDLGITPSCESVTLKVGRLEKGPAIVALSLKGQAGLDYLELEPDPAQDRVEEPPKAAKR